VPIINFLKVHKKTGLICFFVLFYAALLAGKFFPLISLSEILPGNDTLGHFWAWREFHSHLAEGRFWNYSIYWFGGTPILQFYAPLGFLLMSGFYALLGHFVSQFLIFRWFVFLAFAVFPWPFYFFIKNYLGKTAAYFSLPVSLLVVFYPPFMNFMGFGAAGAVIAGLFDQIFAVNFLLLYLVALKKLIESDNFNWKWVLGAVIFLALIFLSHTLTSIMAGILTCLIGLVHYRRWFKNKLFHSLSAVIALAFSLSAFWLWPFIVNLQFTSAERIDTNAFLSSALKPLLPFYLNDLWQGGWATFSYVWVASFLMFLIGLSVLLKNKQYLLPLIFFVIFFIFGLDYLNPIFPKLTIHYYRLLGYDILFFLAIASVGLAAVWGWARRKKQGVSYGLVLIGAIVLAQYLYFFNLTGLSRIQEGEVMTVSQMTDISYFWSLPKFSSFSDANRVVSDLQSPLLPVKPQRVMPDMSPALMSSLSSIHFFNTALPLANGQASLFGLYVESAWQIPFIFSTTNLITGNGMRWGRVKDLTFNSYFQNQSLESMVQRLQSFGVDYLVVGPGYFSQQANKIKEAQLIKSDGRFKIYHLRGAKPLIYAAGHIPGLFVRHSGLSFREFALGWYSVPELLDYPVADWSGKIKDLTKEDADKFSFIIIELDSEPDPNFIARLKSLGKPLLFLNESSASLALSDKDIWEVDNFQSIALPQYNSPSMKQPNIASFEALTGFIKKYARPNEFASSTPKISSFSGEKISFNANGPCLVNLSYFPYWKNISGDEIYPVTPGQMLIFASGGTNLEYRAGLDTKVGKWLSIIAGVSIVCYLAYRLGRRKRARRLF